MHEPATIGAYLRMLVCFGVACVRSNSTRESSVLREQLFETFWPSRLSRSLSESPSDISERIDRASPGTATPVAAPIGVPSASPCWFECLLLCTSKGGASFPMGFGHIGLAVSFISWYHENPANAMEYPTACTLDTGSRKKTTQKSTSAAFFTVPSTCTHAPHV